MESSSKPETSLPKYCSVSTTLKATTWAAAAPPWDFSFTCPFALRAPCLSSITRYPSYHPCVHMANPAWQERARDAADKWVLAQREPDGFYYRAQIKVAPELEKQGALLVEFEAPLVTGPRLPAQQQRVVLKDDVIQFSPSLEYSLQQGDKVLALWEPGQLRYGPGTILWGLETGSPHRGDGSYSDHPGLRKEPASKEEITVRFWNGKIATVPIGGVWWVPPAMWKRAVEKLHELFVRECASLLPWAPCSSLLGPVTGCATKRLPLSPPFPDSLSHPTKCCQLMCQGCHCCCPLAGTGWWPLSRTTEVTSKEHSEETPKPTKELLPLEGIEEEEETMQAPVTISSSASSSSSSSSSSNKHYLESDLEMDLPQKLMVDSSVNTDPIFLDKPARQVGLCQPKWRYWRRNGPEPPPGKPARGALKKQKPRPSGRRGNCNSSDEPDLGIVEKKELSFTAGGNAISSSLYGKQYGDSSEDWKLSSHMIQQYLS